MHIGKMEIVKLEANVGTSWIGNIKIDWKQEITMEKVGNIASNVEYTIMTESKRSFDLEYAIYQCIRAFDFESLRSFRLK